MKSTWSSSQKSSWDPWHITIMTSHNWCHLVPLQWVALLLNGWIRWLFQSSVLILLFLVSWTGYDRPKRSKTVSIECIGNPLSCNAKLRNNWFLHVCFILERLPSYNGIWHSPVINQTINSTAHDFAHWRLGAEQLIQLQRGSLSQFECLRRELSSK